MIKPQTLKGFRDFLPEVAIKRNWLKQIISEIFELWGYDPLETPTLEPLELFAGQIGEEEKLFFKFKDPGGRDVALRYDQTVPTCRVVGQYNQQLSYPFKRYQIQPAFRAEKPQRGRYREFLQCDADIFGIESPYADAEVIALSLDIYRRLGFKTAKALINDRSLLKDIPYPALASIDKLKKIGEQRVLKEMKDKGIATTNSHQYLKKIQNLKPSDSITIISNYLEDLGFNHEWYSFEPTIVRSFSYSTGIIWEIEIPGFTGGSVLGGERYDQLVEKISGVNIPGTGFGLGFDRTLEAAEQFGLIPQKKTTSRVLVTVFNKDLQVKSLEITSSLRRLGINTDIYTNPEANLDKQLKYADRKGIPFVITIGPEEVVMGKVKLKDMKNRKEQLFTLDRVINKLKGN